MTNQTAKERCPVFILDLYISKLPKDSVSFYCKPMSNAPLDETSPWYYNIPVEEPVMLEALRMYERVTEQQELKFSVVRQIPM